MVSVVLILFLLAGKALAANVDLLLVLDKNGTHYTLQQTISVHSSARMPKANQPLSRFAAASTSQQSRTRQADKPEDQSTKLSASSSQATEATRQGVEITLDENISNVEIIFVGPGQQIYNERYLQDTQPPKSITINSGSVIIRYQHQLADPADDGNLRRFGFLLSEVAIQAQFDNPANVLHSASIVLPEVLEFAGNAGSPPRRHISVRATGQQAFHFPVNYRLVDFDEDGITDTHDFCPDSPSAALVDRTGCEPDADNDGISDIVDTCPQSSAGAIVDGQGCEPDADEDGLPDHYDQCDETPADYPIGKDGCSLDTDQDGVADGIDQCPDSAPDEPVTRHGCSLDFDKDGIPNFRDQCESTSYGRVVDEFGCETDSDADGLPDRLDVCVNSPANIEVGVDGCALDRDSDKIPDFRDICLADPAGESINAPEGIQADTYGCPVAGNKQDDRVALILPGLRFSTDSAFLTAEARQILDRVARAIKHHEQIEFEIGAHTDNVGKAPYNLQLSQSRAETVRQYLMVRGVSPNRVIARGYGESAPIRRNTTEGNRAVNRRIELLQLDS